MKNINHPLDCKCGSKANAPQWSAWARGFVVSCERKGCPASVQAKTAEGAVDRWNQMATSIFGKREFASGYASLTQD